MGSFDDAETVFLQFFYAFFPGIPLQVVVINQACVPIKNNLFHDTLPLAVQPPKKFERLSQLVSATL